MPIYRVKWIEEKSIVVDAESEAHAEHLAYDLWSEKATLESQEQVSIKTDAYPMDDERIWSEDSEV